MDFPQKVVKGLVKETGKLFSGAGVKPAWNPEDSIAEKREWTSRNSAFSTFSRNSASRSRETTMADESLGVRVGSDLGADGSGVGSTQPGTRQLPMFDYFCVVGLENRPETVDAVWEKSDNTEECTMNGATVLYSYPLSGLPEDLKREIPSYCFPIGTVAYAVKRSAGMSELAEITDVVYGQHYDLRSDASFVFQLQTTTADRPTPEMLFGVCFYRKEFLHRRPKMFNQLDERGLKQEMDSSEGIPERLVASGRCYCLLSRVPMFERHFELLRNILSFERHHQIEEYAKQVDEGLWAGSTIGQSNNASAKPSVDQEKDTSADVEMYTPSFPHRRSVTIIGDISSSDSEDDLGISGTSARGGDQAQSKSHHERKLTSISDFHTPEDTPSAPLLVDDDSDLTPFFTAGERVGLNNDKTRRTKSAMTKRTMSRLEYSRQRTHTTSTDDDLEMVRKNLTMLQLLDELEDHCQEADGNRNGVANTNNESVELGSWIEADSNCHSNTLEDTAASRPADEKTAERNNRALQNTAHTNQPNQHTTASSPINQAWYNRHPLKLLEQYKALEYRKWVAAKEISVPVANLINARGEPISSMKCSFVSDIDFLAAKELEGWAICVLCRALSVENIVRYLTAVLLERQIVVFESNIAYLSAIVLSLQPLLTPFTWQSLLLPIVPIEKQDLLEAPVPFVVGMLTKTRDIRSKCTGLVRINAYKDDVKNTGHIPRLPNAKALIRSLEEPHAKIRRYGIQYGSDSCPIYEISPEERTEAMSFAEKVRQHLLGLTSELAFFYVTDVGAAADGRGTSSILMRDAFVESFDEGEDRRFVDEWTQSQMFDFFADWITYN